MPDANRTEIVVLLDRSGSMADMKRDMEKGFDELKKTQLDVPGECLLTLVQFDTMGVDTVYEAKPVRDVPPLKLEPRGGTPLLDAMGDTVLATGRRLEKLDDAKRPGKVIFVVLTDGEENSSHRFTKEQIQSMVKEQRDKYSWQFMYLGADVDSFAEQAYNIGTYTANSVNYAKAHAATAMNMVGQKIASYRSSNLVSSLDYSDEDRDKLKR